MPYLVLSILCSIVIANYLKFLSHRKHASILAVFLGNYFVAAILSYFLSCTPVREVNRFDIIMGVVAGVFLIATFLIYQKSIDKCGLAISVSSMRASLMVPVMVSLIWFGESLAIWNYFGIILVLLAFVILGKRRNVSGLKWIIALFISMGLMDSFFKIYKVFAEHSAAVFLMIGYSMAFLVTLILILYYRQRIPWRSLLWGFLLGIPNQLTAWFFMKSLDTIPATIAYPLRASSIVLLCVAADILLWKLRIGMRQAIGYGIIVVGIVLLNIS